MNKLLAAFCIFLVSGSCFESLGFADTIESSISEVDAKLVDGFTKALDKFAKGRVIESNDAGVNLWLKGMRERGIKPEYIRDRLQKKSGLLESGRDRFSAYRKIKVETFAKSDLESELQPVALHAFRLDVIEDYDDVLNDDVYCYFIVTHDDMMWGKVTSIYKGLDEGDSVFLSPEDRGLFGPRGEKIAPKNYTIIDYGIIESDGDDIKQLHKLSDAIVDLALVALTVYNPQAGASAAQAREETKNLLRLVIELDNDDRLVTDTIRFTPDVMASMLSGSPIHEFSRVHRRSTTWTGFEYKLNFRLLK